MSISSLHLSPCTSSVQPELEELEGIAPLLPDRTRANTTRTVPLAGAPLPAGLETRATPQTLAVGAALTGGQVRMEETSSFTY